MTKSITLTIGNDTSSIGADATSSDLDQFAKNLADAIADKFDVSVLVVRGSSWRMATSDNADVESWLSEISQSDEWQRYL